MTSAVESLKAIQRYTLEDVELAGVKQAKLEKKDSNKKSKVSKCAEIFENFKSRNLTWEIHFDSGFKVKFKDISTKDANLIYEKIFRKSLSSYYNKVKNSYDFDFIPRFKYQGTRIGELTRDFFIDRINTYSQSDPVIRMREGIKLVQAIKHEIRNADNKKASIINVISATRKRRREGQDNLDVVYKQGISELDQLEFETALETFEHILSFLEYPPTKEDRAFYTEVLLAHAHTHHMLKDYSKSVASFKKALSILKTYSESKIKSDCLLMVYLRLCRIYLEANDPIKAFIYAPKTIRILSMNLPESFSKLNELIEDLKQAWVSTSSSTPSSSSSANSSLLNQTPTIKMLYLQGEELLKQKKHVEAKDAFKKGLKIVKSLPREKQDNELNQKKISFLYTCIAFCSLKAGEHAAAIKNCAKALEAANEITNMSPKSHFYAKVLSCMTQTLTAYQASLSPEDSDSTVDILN